MKQMTNIGIAYMNIYWHFFPHRVVHKLDEF